MNYNRLKKQNDFRTEKKESKQFINFNFDENIHAPCFHHQKWKM